MIRTMPKKLRKTSLKLSLNIVDTAAFSRRFSDINKILLDKNSKIPPASTMNRAVRILHPSLVKIAYKTTWNEFIFLQTTTIWTISKYIRLNWSRVALSEPDKMTSLEFSVFGFKYQNNECHILSTGQLLFCTVSPTDFKEDLNA